MSKSAFIRDIESLEQLRVAIIRFYEENQLQINAIDSKIESKLNLLKSNESRLISSIQIAEDNLHRAKSDLQFCESDTYEDDEGNTVYPNCDYEENEVINCRNELAIANNNYNIFKSSIRNLEQNIANYQKPKFQYKDKLNFTKEQASHSLSQLINGAEDYLSVNLQTETSSSNLFSENRNELKSVLDTLVLGVPKLILEGFYSFFSLLGNSYSFSNLIKKDIVDTVFRHNNENYNCSKLKIKGQVGTILNIDIPSPIRGESVGKNILENVELICRTNGCKEINTWSSIENIEFYQKQGFAIRDKTENAGADVYKELDDNYDFLQKEAGKTFESSSSYIEVERNDSIEVNPLLIVSPESFENTKFWKQRGSDGSPEKYIELLHLYTKGKTYISEGKTSDEIFSLNDKVHNAISVFQNQPIRLIKKGNYYQVDQGRHRVMAAQYHFKKTGQIIPLTADVIEYKL